MCTCIYTCDASGRDEWIEGQRGVCVHIDTYMCRCVHSYTYMQCEWRRGVDRGAEVCVRVCIDTYMCMCVCIYTYMQCAWERGVDGGAEVCVRAYRY